MSYEAESLKVLKALEENKERLQEQDKQLKGIMENFNKSFYRFIKKLNK
jgi:hypothetical protein